MNPEYQVYYLFGQNEDGGGVIVAFCVPSIGTNVTVYPFRVHHAVTHLDCTNTGLQLDRVLTLFTTNNMSKGLAKDTWDELVAKGFIRFTEPSILKFDIEIKPTGYFVHETKQEIYEEYNTPHYALEA